MLVTDEGYGTMLQMDENYGIMLQCTDQWNDGIERGLSCNITEG